jgi:cytochrome c-type biogenesis protein
MTVPIVLAAAAVLGALSFFEPCTIATHTLFSARSHARRGSECGRELLTLWGARSLLSVGLLFVPVALAAPFRFGAHFPSIALAVIASVYLVSRFLYIPVPHLEFWKLLPGGAVYPQAVKLVADAAGLHAAPVPHRGGVNGCPRFMVRGAGCGVIVCGTLHDPHGGDGAPRGV